MFGELTISWRNSKQKLQAWNLAAKFLTETTDSSGGSGCGALGGHRPLQLYTWETSVKLRLFVVSFGGVVVVKCSKLQPFIDWRQVLEGTVTFCFAQSESL